MEKFDVQFVLGDLKSDGKLVFNDYDLTIDTFKRMYVVKYSNILEYYYKDDGIIIVTESKEYELLGHDIDKIRKVLDDKLTIKKEVIIDGKEDSDIEKKNEFEQLIFSDSNKYGSYQLYNDYIVINYNEGHTKYDNLIIKYSDITDLDFHATSDQKYMFLYIVSNNGETYDFYFNKDKVNKCRKILESNVRVEKEIYDDETNHIVNTSDQNPNNESNLGGRIIYALISIAAIAIPLIIFNSNTLFGPIKVSGCYYRIDPFFDVKDEKISLCFNGKNATFKHYSNSYSLTTKWYNALDDFNIQNEYGDNMFSCSLNKNDNSKIKCTSFNNLLGSETAVWSK